MREELGFGEDVDDSPRPSGLTVGTSYLLSAMVPALAVRRSADRDSDIRAGDRWRPLRRWRREDLDHHPFMVAQRTREHGNRDCGGRSHLWRGRAVRDPPWLTRTDIALFWFRVQFEGRAVWPGQGCDCPAQS